MIIRSCHRTVGWLMLWCLHVAAVQRPRCPTDSCIEKSYSKGEFVYTINGTLLRIKFIEGLSYTITCGSPLEHSGLPRFPQPWSANIVTLVGCAPPADLGAALLALGVRPIHVSVLNLLELPAAPSSSTLHTLPALENLKLYATAPLCLPESPLPPQLSSLRLRHVRPPPELPRLLKHLELVGTGVTTLPLDGLERLKYLLVDEDALGEAGAAGLGALLELHWLTLSAPLRALPPLPPQLRDVELRRVSLAGLRGWPTCQWLTALRLHDTALGALDDDWLAGCGALRQLQLTRHSALRLPAELLRHTPLLERLTLTSNNIDYLPEDLLAPVATSLQKLDLSQNRLRADSLPQLPATLQELRLADNPLGDLCEPPERGSSPLARLQQLRVLDLSRTNASHLCADWLRLSQLQHLNLTNNLFTDLQLDEVVVTEKGRRLELILRGNPLLHLMANRSDYEHARTFPNVRQVELLLGDSLRCDCRLYWAAAALRRPAARVTASGRCEPAPHPPAAQLLRGRAQLLLPAPPVGQPETSLRKRALEHFTCVVKDDLCAEECDCVMWPPKGMAAACAGSRLPALPALVAASVARLPTELPPSLMLIDVGSPDVTISSGEQLLRLAAGGREVLLATAVVHCHCGVLEAASALRPLLLDLAVVRCVDGRALETALATLSADCSVAVWPGALAATAGVVVLLAAAVVLRRRLAYRRLPRPAADDCSEVRLFDVFVWHCAADEGWVCGELLPALEAAGLCVCVKGRDWPPGAWLPRQLRLSVYAARTVLLVLSRAAQACSGARFELDELSAGGLQRSRLVLLRRDGVCAPRLPALAMLRANDPQLWDKLLKLMPVRSPPPTSAPVLSPVNELGTARTFLNLADDVSVMYSHTKRQTTSSPST